MNFEEIVKKEVANLSVGLESGDIQRSEEWFEKRHGRFTGSEIKKLMACDRSASKMEWGRKEKLIALGDTALMYIFEKAFERKTGIRFESADTFSMRYGRAMEEVVKKQLRLTTDIIDVDFEEFIPGIAGASADGRRADRGLEIKSPTSASGLYNRIIDQVDQSHDDFWQLQAEMLALKVDKMDYVIAYPAKDLMNPEFNGMEVKEVVASPIHQKAIIDRCMLGDNIIKLWLDGVEWYEAVRRACSEF